MWLYEGKSSGNGNTPFMQCKRAAPQHIHRATLTKVVPDWWSPYNNAKQQEALDQVAVSSTVIGQTQGQLVSAPTLVPSGNAGEQGVGIALRWQS